MATTFGPQPLIFAMTERDFFSGMSFFIPYRHNSWKEDLTSPIQQELLLHYSSWTLKQFHLSTDHGHHLHILFFGGEGEFWQIVQENGHGGHQFKILAPFMRERKLPTIRKSLKSKRYLCFSTWLCTAALCVHSVAASVLVPKPFCWRSLF